MTIERGMSLAAITDEFSADLGTALAGMTTAGMTGAELRVVNGRNILEWSNDDVDAMRRAVEAAGMRVVSIASPVLKCVLPGGPAIDARLAQDVFGARYTFEDHERLAARALDIAERCGAGIVRVFSGWRTVDPDACFDTIAAMLADLGDRAATGGLVIAIENEYACNVGTGAEAARMIRAVAHPAVKVLWDPANASILGEVAYPDGYRCLSPADIVHVHAKDCRVRDYTPTWGLIGEMDVDWRGQLRALHADGYRGFVSLETHWRGPRDDKFEASLISAKRLRGLIDESAWRGPLSAVPERRDE